VRKNVFMGNALTLWPCVVEQLLYKLLYRKWHIISHIYLSIMWV